MISVRHLDKYFNKGRQNEVHVINDISLELPGRGIVAVFGRSGCGKTTLLNAIGGLDRFGGGEVLIEGQDIRRNTDDIRNRYIGYIFQNYNLNPAESNLDNVADALRLCGIDDEDELEARATAALANVGMEKFARRTPDTLSGGQRQRVAIARAIVKNPPIILADEPTGNLDEANTVMVMDLLLQIAKDHLVILVTHEENLVDYYCDTVVEISDGRVTNLRGNEDANGFSARNKNDIFLGEFEKKESGDDKVALEYYGDTPDEPIRLRVVRSGGKTYLRVDTPGVQILDESSEIRLREGVYAEHSQQNEQSAHIDMSALPPVKGGHYGRLFRFGSALKSGYKVNFSGAKKGKKLLKLCMASFAAVLVILTAVLGTSLDQLIDIRNSYNHNTFYLYTGDVQTAEKLAAADPEESGIDDTILQYGYAGEEEMMLRPGYFDYVGVDESTAFRQQVMWFGESLCKDLPLVVGKNKDLAVNEMVITTATADALLENSPFGYIKEYRDLIGLCELFTVVDGRSPRIVGIVRSSENAAYLSDYARAKQTLVSSDLRVHEASRFGLEISEGKTVYAASSAETIPKDLKTVRIHGIPLEVTGVIVSDETYEQYLERRGVVKKNLDTYLKEKYSPADDAAYKRASDEHYFEYLEYYYDTLGDYTREFYLLNRTFDSWLWAEKGIYAGCLNGLFFDGDFYYRALNYREENGTFPKYNDLPTYPTKTLEAEMQTLKARFYDEFEEYLWNAGTPDTDVFLLNTADYIRVSKQAGETDPAAMYGTYSKDGYSEEAAKDGMVLVAYGEKRVYTVIHSSDPAKTEAYLRENFGDAEPPDPFSEALITPDDQFDSLISGSLATLIGNLIAFLVVLAFMSVCVYFIMRSALLGRIKEVGIYRAIGVSEKNLVFRFFAEALVLTSLTVLIGFVIASAFVYFVLGLSSMMASVFFYPWWLCGALLALVYALCLFCGILPVLLLLRKTPSEILAKYDI